MIPDMRTTWKKTRILGGREEAKEVSEGKGSEVTRARAEKAHQMRSFVNLFSFEYLRGMDLRYS